MTKTLAFLAGASALALVGLATAPQPAAAGSHVGIDVGPGGVYIGPRHRDYDNDDYGNDDWRRNHHHDRGAYSDRDLRYRHQWE